MPDTLYTNGCPIHFNSEDYKQINAFLKHKSYSTIFILVDENTHNLCLPDLISNLETASPIEIIEIEAGEAFKNIETCHGVWSALSELGADRKSLMINLGGGVVTDLGGFVAATFMRGIDFLNIPTTLLAMVDASVGGKTGVDLGSLKNQVGVIRLPEMVFINTRFLKTLPENQFRSGIAEMLKHGLIYSKSHWDKLNNIGNLNTDEKQLEFLIFESVSIKNNIVSEDPTEQGLRKILNFGHTLGHAIESYFLKSTDKPTLLHGEAIAIGLILESFLSSRIYGMNQAELTQIKDQILTYFNKVSIEEKDISPIIELMKFDKKNTFGDINFVLLADIANAKTDCKVTNDLIRESFAFYDE